MYKHDIIDYYQTQSRDRYAYPYIYGHFYFSMAIGVLTFMLGVLALQQLTSLPDPLQLMLLAALAAVSAYKRHGLVLAFLFGLIWASLIAWIHMAHRLPASHGKANHSIEGYISSLPQYDGDRVSFDFTVTHPERDFPGIIRLSWYKPHQSVRAGQTWRMTAKIGPPHGLLNPGGFDYQAWLFANDIGAVGYVRDKPAPLLLSSTARIGEFFSRWRQIISERMDNALLGNEQLGLIKALTIGAQDGVSQKQWEVFKATGTTHLVVISGSHISLIAGAIYLWCERFWTWIGILRYSPQRFAALFSWLTGLFYAGLAGYSIPTFRAEIMLTVVLAAMVWQRNTTPLQILLLALLAVLLIDPFAVLSVGFWLSFVAVGLLIYVSASRLGRRSSWKEAAMAQLAAFVGISPLLMGFFQQFSLISPLANCLAVPIIGVAVVPLALLAAILLFLYPPLAVPLLNLTATILQGLFWLLTQMANFPWSRFHCPQPSWQAMSLAGLGALVLLAPRGVPGRYLAAFLFLPLFFPGRDIPSPGNIRFTLLDVGQGLSAVVQTAGHTLVFDTGGKFSESSDMGESVVLPFLQHQGVENIDALIISHGDNDHDGGAATLLKSMKVKSVYSSVAEWAEIPDGQYCQEGQHWEWDRVRFTMLSPPGNAFAKENDNSCVLRIAAGQELFLLTGDIEATAENWLSQHYGEKLKSSVLIAPHHGSKTSSSQGFLELAAPGLILIPAGHLNRFGFPHKQILKRYEQLRLPWLNTADKGAITLQGGEADLVVETERDKRKRYWMETGSAAGEE